MGLGGAPYSQYVPAGTGGPESREIAGTACPAGG